MTMTITNAWKTAQARLKAAGVDTSAIDARLLVERAFDLTRAAILADPHRPARPDDLARLDALVRRREAREPLAYIIGRKPFWTFDLEVTPDVLIPRPDTETVVSAILEETPLEARIRVLDIGVGSGAIVLAILSERPNAVAVAVDVSPAALAVARANAQRLGLADRADFREGVWGQGLDGPFDLVVSNPPYIASAVIDRLEPEVRHHEPRLALDGGDDGLDAYRALLPDVARLLGPGGRFALEVGFDQAAAVQALARATPGVWDVAARRDLTGQTRVVVGRKRLV